MKRRDWTAIREQYVTTATSLRTLARESRVPFGSLAKVARREDWNLARRVYGDKAGTATVTRAGEQGEVLSWPERSANLRERIIAELEKDTEAVSKAPPQNLESAKQRQDVLNGVVRNAGVVLNWDNPTAQPLVRIAIMGSVTIGTAPPPAAAPIDLPDATSNTTQQHEHEYE